MKTTTILTAALLTLQTSFLFASTVHPVTGTRESSAGTFSFLAPVTPTEATFEETAIFAELAALAPVAPAEATFEDGAAAVPAISDLAPAIPAEADFE